jgi:hypothetical protein
VSLPPPTAGAPRELVVALEAHSGRRRRAESDARVVLSALGVRLEHPLCRVPLRLPLGSLALAAIERGATRAADARGRFPVLKRLGHGVVPVEEGLEGWLWTSTGGSALTVLAPEDQAPNLALVLAQPLGEEVIARTFHEEVVQAVAARSPLGAPSLYGLLLKAADAGEAERAFARLGLLRELTDREVPKTLRRSLPTDRSADPAVIARADRRAESSVAPPGLG